MHTAATGYSRSTRTSRQPAAGTLAARLTRTHNGVIGALSVTGLAGMLRAPSRRSARTLVWSELDGCFYGQVARLAHAFGLGTMPYTVETAHDHGLAP